MMDVFYYYIYLFYMKVMSDDWYYLIYYNPPKKGEKMGIDVLYDDLIEYIDNSTKQLIESKTIELKKV